MSLPSRPESPDAKSDSDADLSMGLGVSLGTSGPSSSTASDNEYSENDLSLDTDESDDEQPLDESLSVTIVQEIEEGSYVCLVCTCEIDRYSEIWSCDNCYRVYDLDCIKDWAVRGSSTTDRKKWRCPACSIEHSKLPSKFTCWCGRVTNPSAESFIPFSCGNPCDSKYPNCVHACSSVCHPGKHPECGALGPVMPCSCGKHKRQLPCLVTPYENGWKCDTPCDNRVCALNHLCSKGDCHLGFCGACQEPVTVRCYCGSEELAIECHTIKPKECTEREARDKTFVGGGSCKSTVIEYYTCGVHFEEFKCQPLPKSSRECKFDPKIVKSCYCGKTPATPLTRKHCTDPMPECENICGKLLDCGCTCLVKCHEGACECFNLKESKCSCQTTTYLVPCKSLQRGFTPKCHHKCMATLSCRRHTHREECCEFEQVALKRERDMKKLFRNRTRTSFEDQILTMEPIHICTRTCNMLKLCRIHRCPALCHSGACGPCLESSSEDLVCHCGKTIVPAPVRCGTKIECHEQCVRQTPCGHRPEKHACHDDSKSCPKCTFLVTKACNCGSNELKNIICSVQNVSCGKICSAKKACGHPCNSACNKNCTQGVHGKVTECQSMCRKIRKMCPHMCAAKCHYGKNTSCDLLKCNETVKITCTCGRLTRTTPCSATLTEPTKIGTMFECDEECAQAKREEELRKVFNLSPQEFVSSYPESVLNVFKRQSSWCLKMESIIRDFVSDYQDCVSAGLKAKRSLHFPPMTSPQRAFIHDLASVLKLYSESQDKEPLRSVFICITELTFVPSSTIKEVLDKRDDLEQRRRQLEDLKLNQLELSFFNAVVISDVFFGITKEVLEENVAKIVKSFPEIEQWQLQWIKENTFVFYHREFQTMDKEKEDRLFIILKTFKKSLRENLIAFDCKMCLVDEGVDFILKTDQANVAVTEQIESPKTSSRNAFEILQEEESL